MRITRIQIRNFVGIDFVKIDKIGNFTKFTGENGVGKTSLLDAIMATCSLKGVHPELIKAGADQSELLCEFDDKTLVERVLTAKDNTVKVSVNGVPIKKPVAYLTERLPKLGLNPIAFYHAKPAQQRAIILAAIPCRLDRDLLDGLVAESEVSLPLDGVDFAGHGLTILETLRNGVYDRRHLVNQSVLRLLKSIEDDTARLPDGVEPKRWDDFDLDVSLSAMTEAQKQISGHDARKEQIGELKKTFHSLCDEERSLTARLEEVRKRKASNEVNGKALGKAINTFEPPDIDAMQSEISEYKEHLKYAATLEGITKKRAEHDTAAAESKALDWMHDKLKTEVPQMLIEQADIGIDGLSFPEDGIMVGDTPLQQLSEGERAEFAVDLNRVLPGKFKFACIDGYEAVRGKLRKRFEAKMKADDIEYFIAEATDDPELAVDGGTLSTEGE